MRLTPGIVVGSILLASHQLLGMEQLAVDTSPHFINDSWFQINKDSPGHMLARSSLREEGVEAVISTSDSLVRRHGAIWLDTCVNICSVSMIRLQ